MAARFDILDLRSARRVFGRLERELKNAQSVVAKAAVVALNRSLRTGKSEASRQIRATLALKKRVVDQRISYQLRSRLALEGRLTVRNKRVELAEFMTAGQLAAAFRRQNEARSGRVRGRARRISGGRTVRAGTLAIKVYKNRPAVIFPGYFVNVGRRSGRWHVMSRAKGAERYPAFIRYGPALTDVFQVGLPKFVRFAADTLERNLDQALRRFGFA